MNVVLEFTRNHWLQMLATAWDAYPLEGCGLLIGASGGDRVERFVPIRNEAESSRVYQLDGRQYAKAAMAADDDGLDIIGVMHSHTHTLAFPSPTDVAEATKPLVPPSWHWVIVSLAWGFPELHSFRIGGDGASDTNFGGGGPLKPGEIGTAEGIVEEEVRLSL